MPPWLKRALKLLTALLLILTLGVVGLACALHRPRPQASPSPEADALAMRMLATVNHDAWLRTGAVRWRFPGGHQHLWDRTRGLARVRWDDHEVLIHLGTQRGLASTDGQRVTAEDADKLVAKAWALWCNDAFWLNPLAKSFDPGTSRAIVTLDDGAQALLVSYDSGGVTPGDAYLWEFDPQGRPKAWSMWVSILPIGGVVFTWEGWRQLPTGAWLATQHRGVFGLPLNLEQVEAAATLAELEPGPDPFAPLIKAR